MDFITKNKKIIPKLNLEKDFYQNIKFYSNEGGFIRKMDEILLKETGHDFEFIWNTSNLKHKIEVVLFLKKNISKFDVYFSHTNVKLKNYLENFIKIFNIKVLYYKINHYIEKKDWKIIDGWKIVSAQESAILSNATKQEKNDYLDFKKAKTLKNKESIIFKVQKPIYQKLKERKEKIGNLINLKELKRLLEVFVRHGEEATDQERRKYYDNLSDEEKILKLDEIYLIILIFKHKLKEREKIKKKI